MKKAAIAILLAVFATGIASAQRYRSGSQVFRPGESRPYAALAQAGQGRSSSEFRRIMGQPLEIIVYPNDSVLIRGLVASSVSSSSIQATFAQNVLPLPIAISASQNTVVLDRFGRRVSGVGMIGAGDILSLSGTVSGAAQGSSTPSVAARIIRDWSLPNRGGGGTTTASTTRTVTMADNNTTVSLRRGDTFLLSLGEGYNWNVTVADPSIVSRVANILVVRGAQGVYRANNAGTTTLTAIGSPACSGFVCSFRPTVRFQATTTVSQ